MFCKYCGSKIPDDAKFCTGCGAAVDNAAREAAFEQAAQQRATYQQPAYQQPVETKDKLVAGLLGIFLGALGIHKFYLGYTKSALVMLLVSVLTFGLGAFVMGIIGLIEGILYLTKSDAEFKSLYVDNTQQWF